MKKQIVFTFLVLIQVFHSGFIQDEHDPAQLLGRVNVKTLQNQQRFAWFSASYSDYKTNPSAISEIAKQAQNLSILVFAGTWDITTQSQLGPFYKIIDESKIDRASIILYFLDRDKKSPQGFESSYFVSEVPTFILLKGNQEIGRLNGNNVGLLEGALADLLLK
jgi:hypothetical protein